MSASFLFFCLHRCQKAPHIVRLIVPTSAEVTKKIATTLLVCKQKTCRNHERRNEQSGHKQRRRSKFFRILVRIWCHLSDSIEQQGTSTQQPEHMNSNREVSGYNSRSGPPTIDDQSIDYGTPVGYQIPTGYHTPSDYPSMPNPHRSPMGHLQTRAAGKVIIDGGGLSLDMSGGSMSRNNKYYLEDGENSRNFITVSSSSPSTVLGSGDWIRHRVH